MELLCEQGAILKTVMPDFVQKLSSTRFIASNKYIKEEIENIGKNVFGKATKKG